MLDFTEFMYLCVCVYVYTVLLIAAETFVFTNGL